MYTNVCPGNHVLLVERFVACWFPFVLGGGDFLSPSTSTQTPGSFPLNLPLSAVLASTYHVSNLRLKSNGKRCVRCLALHWRESWLVWLLCVSVCGVCNEEVPQ